MGHEVVLRKLPPVGSNLANSLQPRSPDPCWRHSLQSCPAWKQRFQNFDTAFVLLRDAMENGPDALNQLEKAGVIQCF